MSRLPMVNCRIMEKMLFSIGFVVRSQKGSHVFYRHPDGRTTTVPHHKGYDLARPLLRAILREIEVSPDEFVRLLQEL